MNRSEKKLLLAYLTVMLIFIILSRLYWIYGDDPIGLILVFFFLAPGVSFLFALALGNSRKYWLFPVIAGCANVLNYMCNSMMTFKLAPDSGTLWVFGLAFAGACAGILLSRIANFLDRGSRKG